MQRHYRSRAFETSQAAEISQFPLQVLENILQVRISRQPFEPVQPPPGLPCLDFQYRRCHRVWDRSRGSYDYRSYHSGYAPRYADISESRSQGMQVGDTHSRHLENRRRSNYYNNDRNRYRIESSPESYSRYAPGSGNRYDRLPPAKKPDNRITERRWSDERAGESSEKLARHAHKVALEMSITGYCATGVQQALLRMGMTWAPGSGHGWDMRNPLLRSGRFEIISESQARRGDIAVRQRPGDYGHIAVLLGTDRQGRMIAASDHLEHFDQASRRYSRTIYLRLKS